MKKHHVSVRHTGPNGRLAIRICVCSKTCQIADPLPADQPEIFSSELIASLEAS